MKVKIKKLHPDAVIPKYAKDGDAGLDLTAVGYKEGCKTEIKLLNGWESKIVEKREVDKILYKEYDTGIAVEIPEGHVGLVFPRSSISKTEATLANSVGVVDSNYRGSIKLRFYCDHCPYEIGDRVGQLIIMPYPQIEFEEVEELSDTERGSGGFGSSGN